MRLIVYSIILFISFISSGYGKQANDLSLKSANNAYTNADYTEAIRRYSLLKEQFIVNKEIEKANECSIGLSKSKLAIGLFSDAANDCQEAIDLIATKGFTNKKQTSLLYKILGEAYLNSGLNDLALEKLKEAEKYLGTEKTLDYADLMEEIGVVYWNNVNYQLATEYHNRALLIRSETLPENHELIADSYTNLGLVSMKDDYLNTLVNFKKALSIYEEKYGENHLKVANVYFNMGFANLENSTYSQANTYFNKVNDIYEQIYSGDHPNKAIIQTTLAQIQFELDNYDIATEKYLVAIKMYLNIYGKKHPELADTYSRLGQVYYKKQDFKEAISNYQKAIYANLRDQEYLSDYDLPKLEKFFNADYLLSSLQAKAQTLERLHYDKTLKPRDINSALDTYILCDSLVSNIKQIRLSEEDKIKTSALSNEIYRDGIRISIDIASKSLKKKYYQGLAYQFFERSKASTLHEAINDTQAKSFAGIPNEVLQKETALTNEIVRLENKIIEHGNAAEQENILTTQLFEKNNEYRNFISRLEKEYPAYYELKYKSSLASVSEIQSALKEKEVIVSYFFSQSGQDNTDNSLFIMSISKKKLDFKIVNLNDEFFKQLRGFRNAIKFKVERSVDKIGRNLFEVLFPTDVYENNSFFTIIPDGLLGTIPFEALIDEKGQYIIETKNINYDFSANLYFDNISKTRKNTGKILAIAPVNFNSYDNYSLDELPGTSQEVKTLAKVSRENNLEVSTWINSEASEYGFKSANLKEYDIIHFATHGEVNESEPNLSRIFLYNGESNNDDGFLYSSEIYNLKLNADLITLSACETGLGKVAKGEGIIGLSRSLKYAGGKNLIVSLWKVADQSTSELMIDFYKKQQSEQSTYSKALRNAKLSLLYSKNYNSPYYWAPFILIGK